VQLYEHFTTLLYLVVQPFWVGNYTCSNIIHKKLEIFMSQELPRLRELSCLRTRLELAPQLRPTVKDGYGGVGVGCSIGRNNVRNIFIPGYQRSPDF
jgi:hypothetical protein